MSLGQSSGLRVGLVPISVLNLCRQRTVQICSTCQPRTVSIALVLESKFQKKKYGAKTIDLEWVQVHSTGLVKPDDPDAKVKFLAAEALRGVGGLVIDKNGKRFANELGRRDYVTGEMWKNQPPFRLCLNKAASDEIAWHCKHYTGRGVMKFYENGEALAKDMGIDVQVLIDTHDQHYKVAKNTEHDPDAGS